MSRPAKLSREQVAELRRWAAFGRTQTEVARRLGVAPNTLRAYLRGEHKTRQEAA